MFLAEIHEIDDTDTVFTSFVKSLLLKDERVYLDPIIAKRFEMQVDTSTKRLSRVQGIRIRSNSDIVVMELDSPCLTSYSMWHTIVVPPAVAEGWKIEKKRDKKGECWLIGGDK